MHEYRIIPIQARGMSRKTNIKTKKNSYSEVKQSSNQDKPSIYCLSFYQEPVLLPYKSNQISSPTTNKNIETDCKVGNKTKSAKNKRTIVINKKQLTYGLVNIRNVCQ